MMAGGASMAPRRKSLPGLAIAMRIKSPCVSTALTTADMMVPNTSALPLAAAVTCSAFSRLMPASVPSEKLLCLPASGKEEEGEAIKK